MKSDQIQLGDLLEKLVDNRGKTPPLADVGVELIETTSLTGGGKFPDYSLVRRRVSQDVFDNWFRSGHPRTGDVLVATVGANIGSAAIMRESRGCVAQNLVGLRVDPQKANPDYIYYYLTWSRTQSELKRLDIGAAQPSLKVPHLLGIQIPLPPLSNQKRIAEVLSAYDDLIENNRQRIEILESLARVVYSELLNSDEASLAPQSMLDSPYWRIISENVSRYNGVKRYFATADIEGLSVTGLGVEYAFEAKPSRAQKQPVPNSVWFARMKDTYKIAWYPSTKDEKPSDIILSSGFAGFQAIDAELWPLLFLAISSRDFHSQKDMYCTGATQMALTNEGLARISLPLPGEETARLLGAKVGPMLHTMAILQKSNVNLRRTRDLVLERLLTGQIDVEVIAA